MILRQTFCICFIVATLAPCASARRPWQPRATVEAVENIGQRKPELTPEAIKRFNSVFNRGKKMYSIGRYRQARNLLAKAIKLHPDHVGARMLHARVLLTLGYLTWKLPMIQEARDDIQHALVLEPRNQDLQPMVELLEGLLRRMTAAPRKPSGKPRKH